MRPTYCHLQRTRPLHRDQTSKHFLLSLTSNFSYPSPSVIFAGSKSRGRIWVWSKSSWDYFLSVERRQQKVKKGRQISLVATRLSLASFGILLCSLGSSSFLGPFPMRSATSQEAEDRNKDVWRVMVICRRDLPIVFYKETVATMTLVWPWITVVQMHP
jgi:hypothetical protein